jgi:hypothetical protein
VRRRYILCGGDERPGRRDACPDPVHDWPLPNGYGDAAAQAQSRLGRGWAQAECGRCGLYGWRPGRVTVEVRVPAGGDA